jgi:hypothetical protein
VTGGAIINVLHYACLQAVDRTPPKLYEADLLKGISRELQKEGRVQRQANRGYLGNVPATAQKTGETPAANRRNPSG